MRRQTGLGRPDYKHHSLLFVGTFIEAREHQAAAASLTGFPYSFAGTFIEGTPLVAPLHPKEPFPFLLEGLSLRADAIG